MNFKSTNTIGQFGLLLVGLVLLLTASACSSDSADDVSDAERFVADWVLVDVTDADGNKLATFNAAYTSFTVSFQSSGNAAFDVDVADPSGTDIMLSGTYAVNEAQQTITITVNPGVPVAIEFDYSFASDQRVNVTTNSIPLNLAFGTTLTGDATITLQRVQEAG